VDVRIESSRKDTCVCVSRYGNPHHLLTLYPYTWKDALVLHMYSHKLTSCGKDTCVCVSGDGLILSQHPSASVRKHRNNVQGHISLCEYIWRTNASFQVYGYSVSIWCEFPYLLTQTHVSFLHDVSLCEYIWRTNASFHVYGYSVSISINYRALLFEYKGITCKDTP